MRLSSIAISALLTGAVALLFTVSGGMLWELGLNYDGISGAMASKIHPATYSTVCAFTLFLVSRRNPASFLPKLIVYHPGSLAFLIATTAVMLFVIVDRRPGLAGLIDTFVLPVLLFLIIAERKTITVHRLETMLHVLLALNALLTLFEFVSRTQVFPYRYEGEKLIDTRPVGFQGHPLPNSVVTGTYIAILLAKGGSNLGILKGPMVLLQWAALSASGGRTEWVLINIFIGSSALYATLRLLAGRRMTVLAWAGCVIGLPLMIVGLVGLEAVGFFDAAIDRFTNDGGSAQARVQMFDILSALPLRALLLNPDMEMIDSLRRAQGLELGIENPIIRFVLYQGIVATSALVIGFTVFVCEVNRTLRSGRGLPLVFFIISIMSFEGLSTKSILLAEFVVLMTAMLRRPTYSRFPLALPTSSAAEGLWKRIP
jgi:hypothetical protein